MNIDFNPPDDKDQEVEETTKCLYCNNIVKGSYKEFKYKKLTFTAHHGYFPSDKFLTKVSASFWKIL